MRRRFHAPRGPTKVPIMTHDDHSVPGTPPSRSRLRLVTNCDGADPRDAAPVYPSAQTAEQRERSAATEAPAEAAACLAVPDEYPALLHQAADLLEQARSVEALREALAFNLRLWRGLAGLFADEHPEPRRESHPDGLGRRRHRLLKEQAGYVIHETTAASCPDDHHIETFITLDRRASRWLAGAPASTVQGACPHGRSNGRSAQGTGDGTASGLGALVFRSQNGTAP